MRSAALPVGETPADTTRWRSGHVATAITTAHVSAGMKFHNSQMHRPASVTTKIVRAILRDESTCCCLGSACINSDVPKGDDCKS